MNEERIKILQMVEDGKISVEDAIKLLDVLRHTNYRVCYNKQEGADFEAKVKKVVAHIDNFGREFGGKMETKFKEMEPAVRKMTKTVVEKTAKVIDEISNSLNESLKNMENKEKCCDDDWDGNCCDDECCENKPEEKSECDTPKEN